MVAALLYLDKRAGAAGKLGHQVRRGVARLHYVGDRARRLRRPAFRVQLFGVAQNATYALQSGPAARVELCCAAGDDDTCIGTRAVGATDGLARLTLGLGGDRAGVDDDRVIQSGGVAAHDLAFVRVQTATERDDFDGHDG